MVTRTMWLRINSALENTRRFIQGQRNRAWLRGLKHREFSCDFIAYSEHLTYRAKLARNHITGGFHLEIPFYYDKVTHKKEKQKTHTYDLIRVKIPIQAKKQNKEKEKNNQIVSFRKLLCIFSSPSSLGKSCHNVSF